MSFAASRRHVPNHQRDGAMALDNPGPAQNYAPVQSRGTSPSGFGHGDPGWALHGLAGRHDERGSADDYTQAGNLYRLLAADAKDRLTSNIAGSLRNAPPEIQQRQVEHFNKADPAYGADVARKLAP